MNKEVKDKSLITEYMLLQHKYSMLLKSLGYRHHTDEDVEELDKMNHILKCLREVFKQEMTMLECIYCIYRKDNIELMYDIEEDVFYIRVYCEYVGSENMVYCTQDYTKEELISILKEMIKVLEGQVVVDYRIEVDELLTEWCCDNNIEYSDMHDEAQHIVTGKQIGRAHV